MTSLVARRLIFACIGVWVSCTDPIDQAAKKRIFSPEDPPQIVAAAREMLVLDGIENNPSLASRIFAMSAGEAIERIGSHRYVASLSWEWMSEGRTSRLREDRELVSGPGGLAGDFHAKIWNSNQLGLEVMRVGGRVFARSTYGKDGAGRFRERVRDRGMAERMRDEAFGALRAVDDLFMGRLRLTADGTTTQKDRTVEKFKVSLAADGRRQEIHLPSIAPAAAGVDQTSRRRQAMFEHRVPKSLTGEIQIDQSTGAIVAARIDGRMTVNAEKAESELHLTLSSSMSDFSKKQGIAVPQDFLPDEDKPDAVAAALARFGFLRKGAENQAPAASEPDDSADRGD